MNDITLSATISRIFVTEIYRTDLGQPAFEEFLRYVEEACRTIAAQDRAGQAWSAEHGYLGYTSYESIPDLTKHAGIFSELIRLLDIHVNMFTQQLHFDMRGQKLKLGAMWINVLDYLGGHPGHFHPNSVISGTFYVVIPEGTSALRFEDPRLGLMMNAPARKANAPDEHQNFFAAAPQRGTMLLWESWLRHEVPVNFAKEKRISVSFNYGY